MLAGGDASSISLQNRTVATKKTLPLEDDHSRVSLKVTKVQTPSRSTITEKETVTETERTNSDGEVFR